MSHWATASRKKKIQHESREKKNGAKIDEKKEKRKIINK